MIHFFGKVDFFEEGGIFIIILPGICTVGGTGVQLLVAEIEATPFFL